MQSLHMGEKIINTLRSQYFMWMDGWMDRLSQKFTGQSSFIQKLWRGKKVCLKSLTIWIPCY